jgi:hypothetical protein
LSITAAMCDYMYHDLPRKHKAKKLVESEPELEKIEEKPLVIKN